MILSVHTDDLLSLSLCLYSQYSLAVFAILADTSSWLEFGVPNLNSLDCVCVRVARERARWQYLDAYSHIEVCIRRRLDSEGMGGGHEFKVMARWLTIWPSQLQNWLYHFAVFGIFFVMVCV